MPTDPPASSHPRGQRITDLLRAHGSGDQEALDRVTPLVYEELQRIAHHHLAREGQGHTLRTTGLVHEAFLKFVDIDRVRLEDRTHFFALSSRLMRQVLTDYARRRRAAKRDPERAAALAPGGADGGGHGGGCDIEELVDLDEALRRLAEVSERQARVVECRFFGGMTVDETSEALDVSTATVKREWRIARAWLNRELA